MAAGDLVTRNPSDGRLPLLRAVIRRHAEIVSGCQRPDATPAGSYSVRHDLSLAFDQGLSSVEYAKPSLELSWPIHTAIGTLDRWFAFGSMTGGAIARSVALGDV